MSTSQIVWGFDSFLNSTKVLELVDGNGNRIQYGYASGQTTVTTKNVGGATVLVKKEKLTGDGRSAGSLDSANYGPTLYYSDPNNPGLISSMTDADGRTVSATFDQFGNRLTETNARGITTTYTYDYSTNPLGRVTTIQVAGKPATTFTYTSSGDVATITGPSPTGSGTVTTSYTYDSLGNVLTSNSPDASGTIRTTSFNYTTDGAYSQPAKIGQVLVITDPLGRKTHFRYDSQGRVVNEWDDYGNVTSTAYNLVGQPLQVALPYPTTTAGRIIKGYAYLYPGGPMTAERVFDPVTGLFRNVVTTYGKEGEVLSQTGDVLAQTMTYDAAYRPVTLTDAEGQTTTTTYNSRGFIATETTPGGDVESFTQYSPSGRVLQMVDRRGQTINLSYNDPEGNLTAIAYPGLTIGYAYDSFGRLISRTDASGSESRSYGDLDELVSVTTSYSGLSPLTISYAYNPDGSRASMTTPAGTFGYGYNSAGDWTSVSNPYAETTSYGYLANGLPQTMTRSNGIVSQKFYDGMGRVIALENRWSGGTIISKYVPTGYDAAGNLLGMSEVRPHASSYNGWTLWNYDNKDSLTREQSNRIGSYLHNFTTNTVGNLSQFKGSAWSYDLDNQRSAERLFL
ncbi:MAG: hypothetical protein R2688_01000 [Fimbriimonadaceae bacterium]